MDDQPELESIYRDAQSAIKAKNYEHAGGLLKQILIIDENYKDASRLLAQIVKLKRIRWYTNPKLWGVLGALVIIGILFWFVPKLHIETMYLPTTTNTAIPATPPTPTMITIPSQTPIPQPTSIPLAWKRIYVGQEFTRDSINAIIVDPNDPDVIYVGAHNAGVYKSINGGKSWQPAQNGMKEGQIGGLAIDPNNTQVLYAVIDEGGLYKTVDGGKSWNQLGNQERTFDSHKIAVAPWDSQVLFQWGEWGILRSDDGGINFSPIADDCLSRSRGGLVVSQYQPGTLFISRLIDSYDNETMNCPSGIYRSQDRGITWERIGMEGYYVPGGAEDVFAVGGMEDRYLYVAANKNPHTEPGDDPTMVYVSSDGGLTWSTDKFYCRSIHVNPLDGREVYCYVTEYPQVSFNAGSTWNELKPTETSSFQGFSLFRSGNTVLVGGDGLFASFDNGVTWQELSAGLGVQQLRLIMNPQSIGSLYLQEGICTLAKDRALYRSPDGGFNWGSFVPWGCDLAFDADGHTLYRSNILSTDEGATWQDMGGRRELSHPQGVLSHPTQSGKIFVYSGVGAEFSFYRSADYGDTWEVPSDTYELGGTYPRLYTDSQGAILYITNGYPNFYYSRDEGTTWQSCGVPIRGSVSDQNLVIDPRDNRHLYAATQGNGILISMDGCQSWQESNTGLDSLFVNAIVMDPNQPDTIYAGTDGGAYISTDGGETWGQINDGLLGAMVVYSIVVDKDSNVYAATPYGIFKLENK